jgi:hypothetical protein
VFTASGLGREIPESRISVTAVVKPVNLPGELNISVRGWPMIQSTEPTNVLVRDDGEKLILVTGAGIERGIGIIVSAIGCCRKCVTSFTGSQILQR